MKKHILALCALVLAGNLVALTQKTAADQLSAFNTMELGPKGHKAQWFDYMQKCHADKTTLMKNHHVQLEALENKQIKKLDALEGSHAAREKFFQEELKDAIILHEKQAAEWEKMCKTHMEEAMKIAAKHKDDLAKFKAQL